MAGPTQVRVFVRIEVGEPVVSTETEQTSDLYNIPEGVDVRDFTADVKEAIRVMVKECYS